MKLERKIVSGIMLILMSTSMLALTINFHPVKAVMHARKILVDATKGGGGWWFPQTAPFNPYMPHQGKALADYLRSLGHSVTELPRGEITIDLDLLSQYDIVIAVASGAYSSDESNAYLSYVSLGGTLLLLTDHHGEFNNLTFSFGLDFRGLSLGSNVVNRFMEHPITSGVTTLTYGVGSGLISYPPDADIIGWLSDDTFIDLNYNGAWDSGEPFGAPVLGCMSYDDGKVMFFGDVNGAIEAVEQPFTDNYINWLSTISANVYIDPDSLNLKSKGKWVTIYIELAEGYDVGDIDISTVELNGEISAELHPTEIGDYDTDGFPGLMVKFSRQDLIAILSVGEATLTVTGKIDDTSFEGSDTIRTIMRMVEIRRRSCISGGDTDQLATPWSYVVDGDWSTKVEWNTTRLGDFKLYIIEDFIVPSSLDKLAWEFKAYHRRAGSLMPTPMEISYWDGSSWEQLYALDDENHVNEVFIETLDMPAGAFSDNKISVKTTMRYSSHVVGAIPPYPPEQLWHFIEYFEGRMICA